VEGKNAVLSAVKGSDRETGDRRSLIVRLYNPSEAATTARLTFAHPARGAQLTNLDEEPQADLPVAADGSVSVPLKPKKIVTVKVAL
jgi:alpha-mannosidase